MRFRHAASLALVVWYLMIPPTRGAPAEILDDAPLSQWDVDGQFDSKVECENKIPSDKDTEERIKQCSVGSCAVTVMLLSDGRCMASDDPRLKNNARVKKNNAAIKPSSN